MARTATFRRRTFRRRRMPIRKRRFRRSFGRGKRRASAGFKRKKAFAGRGRFTVRKLARMMESKMQGISLANTTLTNTGTFAIPDNSSGEFCYCPNQELVQFNPADASGEATATFVGTKIWLRGIRMQTILTNSSSVGALHVKIGVFKTHGISWAAFTNFGQITQISGKGQQQHFYDRQYATILTNPVKYNASINMRGGGPACVYYKEFKVPPSPSTTTEATSLPIDIYLPLNKLETFEADINETDLTTTPNYFANGDYVFVIKFFCARDAVGQDAMRLHAPQFRMYFKDP